jgi:hypothetical protein
MKHLKHMLFCVTVALFAIVMVGCNGGSNNTISTFAGTYSGAYAGTATDGSNVSGRYIVTVANNGQITGNLIAPNGNSLPVTGTVASNGHLFFSTAAGANQVNVAADLASQNNTIAGTGTFSQTVNNVQNASSGRTAMVLNVAGASPFVGNYVGTFTSTTPAGTNGTVNVTVDANGTIAGTANTTGTAAVYGVAGVVAPDGDVTMYAVGDRPGQPRLQFVTTFDGGAVNNGNVGTISGQFATAEAGTTTLRGNFTLTEQ